MTPKRRDERGDRAQAGGLEVVGEGRDVGRRDVRRGDRGGPSRSVKVWRDLRGVGDALAVGDGREVGLEGRELGGRRQVPARLLRSLWRARTFVGRARSWPPWPASLPEVVGQGPPGGPASPATCRRSSSRPPAGRRWMAVIHGSVGMAAEAVPLLRPASGPSSRPNPRTEPAPGRRCLGPCRSRPSVEYRRSPGRVPWDRMPTSGCGDGVVVGLNAGRRRGRGSGGGRWRRGGSATRWVARRRGGRRRAGWRGGRGVREMPAAPMEGGPLGHHPHHPRSLVCESEGREEGPSFERLGRQGGPPPTAPGGAIPDRRPVHVVCSLRVMVPGCRPSDRSRPRSFRPVRRG